MTNGIIPGEFKRELAALVNRYSLEGPSGTPDFIIAEHMAATLEQLNATVRKRADWRGEDAEFHPIPEPPEDPQAGLDPDCCQ